MLFSRSYLNNPRGFTIVELLIVIVVIAILAGITVVAYNGIRARAIDSQSASEFNSIQKALENFYSINGRYPDNSEMNGANGPTTLGLDMNTMSSNINPAQGFSTCNSSSANGRYCYIPGVSSGGSCYAGDICVTYNINYMTINNPTQINLVNKQGKL